MANLNQSFLKCHIQLLIKTNVNYQSVGGLDPLIPIHHSPTHTSILGPVQLFIGNHVSSLVSVL